jgi:hypothetical protein
METTETNRTVSKQTKTNRNNPKFSLKYQNMLSIKLFSLSVDLLFVSVQSKHQNSLFRYRIETTKTKCFETNRNKPEKPQIFLKIYQNMLPIKLFWLVFRLFRFNQNTETLCFGIEAKQPKQPLCFG